MIFRISCSLALIVFVLLSHYDAKSNDETQYGLNEYKRNFNELKSTEQRLIEKLLKNYNKKFRPPGTIEVKFAVNLNQIVNLIEKDQIIVINAFVDHEWRDQRLVWDPLEHDNLTMIRISGDQLWTPDTFIYTTADQSGFLLPQPGAYFVVRSEGVIFWPNPLTQMRLRCRMSILWFPFDDQLCVIVFGSWSYTSSYLNYTLINEEPALTNYTEHNEFIIINYKPIRTEIKFDNWIENDVFSEIRYKILIRRKPLFVIQNCVFPAIMLCILTLVSFFIPFAQEMQIGISIMLAFSVFKLRLSDDVPVQSDSIPLINIYFTLCMSFSLTAMIWFSIINKLKEFKHVPKFIRFIVINYIFLLMCVDVRKKLDKSKASMRKRKENNSQSRSTYAVEKKEICQSQASLVPYNNSSTIATTLVRAPNVTPNKSSSKYEQSSLSAPLTVSTSSASNSNQHYIQHIDSADDERYDNHQPSNKSSRNKQYHQHHHQKKFNAATLHLNLVDSQSDYEFDEQHRLTTGKKSNDNQHHHNHQAMMINNNNNYSNEEYYSPYPIWINNKTIESTNDAAAVHGTRILINHEKPSNKQGVVSSIPIKSERQLVLQHNQLKSGTSKPTSQTMKSSASNHQLESGGNLSSSSPSKQKLAQLANEIVMLKEMINNVNSGLLVEAAASSNKLMRPVSNGSHMIAVNNSNSNSNAPHLAKSALLNNQQSSAASATAAAVELSSKGDDASEDIDVAIRDADVITILNQFVFILFLLFCLSVNFFGLYFAPYYIKKPLSIDDD